MAQPIDLRSDTVTKPSREMRAFMMQAEVGDDVFGEDPTVNMLQDEMAEISGKEAGLFVSSGVMGNQLAIKSHTVPGDEVIVERDSHVFLYETAAPSVWSSVQLMPVHGKQGILNPEHVLAVIRPGAYYFPRSTLVIVENTHNQAGGVVYPLSVLETLRERTKSIGVKIHIDGARIWNASVETGIPLSRYAELADSLSVCFSKGLGAPVGSMLLGDREFIRTAHRFRKLYGGGMRQVGILAGACLFAIRNNIERLAEDHEKARRLADAISVLPGVHIEGGAAQTNIVLVNTAETGIPAGEIMETLKGEGVLVIAVSPTHLRAVTHMDVSMDEIESAVNVITSVMTTRMSKRVGNG